MTPFRRSAATAPLLALAIALQAVPAEATNGYFAHGYGLKAKGMGGVATALAQDAFGGANNPASMLRAGSRLDLGLDWFQPERGLRREGAGFPGLNGAVDSDSRHFVIPEFGYTRVLGPSLAVGVAVFGNGGMNTDYAGGGFDCGGGPANALCGSGRLGVDLTQLIVAPGVAFSPAPGHAFGAALQLGYQRFEANGLQAFDNAPGFPPLTSAPGQVTGRHHDSAHGIGLRLGWQGHWDSGLSLGVSWASEIDMSRFDRYAGLFAGRGDFDIPAHYSLGAAWTGERWTLAADVARILYSRVPAVGHGSRVQAPLGSDGGPGFGWRDITVLKLGTAYRWSEALTLRAGWNRGGNPVHDADVTFNLIAPGVVRDHLTAGFTVALGPDTELTGMLMWTTRGSVAGPSLFDALLGPGAGGRETAWMRQRSLGLGWSRRF